MAVTHPLTVALGGRHYRVERPFGQLPPEAGLVSDVACLPDGRVLVLLRGDPCIAACDPAVADVGDGVGWGGEVIADGHMMALAPDGQSICRR